MKTFQYLRTVRVCDNNRSATISSLPHLETKWYISKHLQACQYNTLTLSTLLHPTSGNKTYNAPPKFVCSDFAIFQLCKDGSMTYPVLQPSGVLPLSQKYVLDDHIWGNKIHSCSQPVPRLECWPCWTSLHPCEHQEVQYPVVLTQSLLLRNEYPSVPKYKLHYTMHMVYKQYLKVCPISAFFLHLKFLMIWSISLHRLWTQM